MLNEMYGVKYACKDCIGDNNIKKECENVGKLHICDYCKNGGKCLDSNYIYEKVKKKIKEEYINSDELMVEGREHFEKEIRSTREILEDEAASEKNEWNIEIVEELENKIEIKTWVKNPFRE